MMQKGITHGVDIGYRNRQKKKQKKIVLHIQKWPFAFKILEVYNGEWRKH